MGLGLGVGLLIGARTVTHGTLPILLLLLGGLFILICMLPLSVRRVLCSVAAGVAVGYLVGHWTYGDSPTDWQAPPETSLTGVIVTDPRVSANGTRAFIEWSSETAVDVETLVFFPAPANVGRGDTVEITGRTGIASVTPMVFADTVRVIQPAPALELRRRAVREYAADAMIRFVPGSAGSLTLGLLIGDDTGLSGSERTDLRASGLAHITAVSGWNVSVVVMSVGAAFRAFGARKWRWLVLQLVFLSAYVWIVGLEPPIVRAAIMGAIALVALQLGRPAHMFTLLFLTAGVMAAINPAVIDSLAYQLSFMSMVGLAVAARICANIEGWKAVIATPTVAASTAGIATAPLLAAAFGTLPLMTVPANMLAGPLIPFATFTGIAVVAFSWISPVADVIGWLGWIISSAVLFISATFARIPGGHHEFAPLGSAAALLIYLALGVAAAAFVPEGRALYQRLEAWVSVEPLAAAASATLIVVVLLGGVVLS